MAKKNKKKSDLQKQQALENQWAFDLAHRLMEEAEFEQSKAFRQAFLVLELLGQLGQGIVTFEYMKEDGTLREARGTLCQRLMPQAEADKVERHEKREPDYYRLCYAYWDWEKQAFRAFRADKVVRICAVSMFHHNDKGLVPVITGRRVAVPYTATVWLPDDTADRDALCAALGEPDGAVYPILRPRRHAGCRLRADGAGGLCLPGQVHGAHGNGHGSDGGRDTGSYE